MNLRSHPIYRHRAEEAHGRSVYCAAMRRIDLRSYDGHSMRASERLFANRGLRRLDWKAHRASFGIYREVEA